MSPFRLGHSHISRHRVGTIVYAHAHPCPFKNPTRNTSTALASPLSSKFVLPRSHPGPHPPLTPTSGCHPQRAQLCRSPAHRPPPHYEQPLRALVPSTDQEVMASAEHSRMAFPFSASKSGSACLEHDLRKLPGRLARVVSSIRRHLIPPVLGIGPTQSENCIFLTHKTVRTGCISAGLSRRVIIDVMLPRYMCF